MNGTQTTENALLVVDWDYFWRNADLVGGPDLAPDWLLYDMSNFEVENQDGSTPLLWQHRADNFRRADPDGALPMAKGWQGFWDRFTGLPWTGPAYYADSNVYSSPDYLLPPDGSAHWDRIDLYDAHHDGGYCEEQGTDVNCGNWMQWHHTLGTKNLRVHYPPWRLAVEGGSELPPSVPMYRHVDDGVSEVATVYQAVFVCRSGAWVPPWCDGQFEEFLAAMPMEPELMPDAPPVAPRDWQVEPRQAAAHMAVQAAMRAHGPQLDTLGGIIASDASPETKERALDTALKLLRGHG